MSTPRIPDPALLFLSVLSARMEELWPELEVLLAAEFGPFCYLSEPFAFDRTAYYDSELGTPISRRVMGFEHLLPQDRLAAVKLQTNAWEQSLARPDGTRLCNLDPGLVTLERLVLATGKNFTHRIYLGQGIWADLTLIFQGGDWQAHPWTFPDYAASPMREHLHELRKIYKQAQMALQTENIFTG